MINNKIKLLLIFFKKSSKITTYKFYIFKPYLFYTFICNINVFFVKINTYKITIWIIYCIIIKFVPVAQASSKYENFCKIFGVLKPKKFIVLFNQVVAFPYKKILGKKHLEYIHLVFSFITSYLLI